MLYTVKNVLKDFPELYGILGKQKIRNLRNATVTRNPPMGILHDTGRNGPCYIVSWEGQLLEKISEPDPYSASIIRPIFMFLFSLEIQEKEYETVLEAMKRIGTRNIAYVVKYDFGDEDLGENIRIYKFPKNISANITTEVLVKELASPSSQSQLDDKRPSLLITKQ